MTKEGTPAVLFRNSIDLNRFSNGVSRKIVQSNIDVIIRAAKQLSKIDPSRPPSYKTARLRSLIKQTKESLSTWEKESVDVMIRELEGLAGVQAGFVEDQIAQALPNGVLKTDLNPLGYSVQTVAVSPSFAKAVVTKDPSVLSLKSTGTFDLTAAQGAEVLLPNGETVQKAFRGLASRQATQFNQVVRTGLLSGETTESIVSQLIGNLQFGQGAKTNQQYLLAGKEVLNMASHQVRTVVRTSVNQVSNAASQQVYKANEDITQKYKYVASLDSRTTALCASLDGKEFEYGKGPEPPQHFNCRSTTVAVIDYDALKKRGFDFDVPKEGRRAAAGGMVPANETYGKWLYGQRKAGTKFTPGVRQIEALGKEKAKYFNRLANKYGADDAIKKFVREDGSEVSLFQLKKRYGKPESITVKKKTAPKVKAIKVAAFEQNSIASVSMGSPAVDEHLQKLISYREKGIKGMVESSWNELEALGGETAVNAKKTREFMVKHKIFNNFAMQGERWKSSNASWYYNKQLKESMKAAVKDLEKYSDNNRTYVGKHKKWFLRNVDKLEDSSTRNQVLQRFLDPPSGRANGYTNMQSSIINTQLTPLSARITASNAKEMKKIAADVLTQTVEIIEKKTEVAKQLAFLDPIDLIDWTTGWKIGKAQKGSSWFVTMIHETGHQIHAKASGGVALGSKWKGKGGITKVTGYAHKNPREQFAEGFVQYVLNPEGLKKSAPRVYSWVEEALEEALK